MDCLGVVSVEEVVSCGRLRWYGHVELKIRVTGYRHAGNCRLIRQGVKVERCETSVLWLTMKRLGLVKDDALCLDKWRSLTTEIHLVTLNVSNSVVVVCSLLFCTVRLRTLTRYRPIWPRCSARCSWILSTSSLTQQSSLVYTTIYTTPCTDLW